jgi:hypothetical protein
MKTRELCDVHCAVHQKYFDYWAVKFWLAKISSDPCVESAVISLSACIAAGKDPDPPTGCTELDEEWTFSESIALKVTLKSETSVKKSCNGYTPSQLGWKPFETKNHLFDKSNYYAWGPQAGDLEYEVRRERLVRDRKKLLSLANSGWTGHGAAVQERYIAKLCEQGLLPESKLMTPKKLKERMRDAEHNYGPQPELSGTEFYDDPCAAAQRFKAKAAPRRHASPHSSQAATLGGGETERPGKNDLLQRCRLHVPADGDSPAEETWVEQPVPASTDDGTDTGDLGDDDDDDVDLKGEEEPGTGKYFAAAVSPYLILSDKKQGHALGFLRDWVEDPANEDDAYHAAASTKLRIGELATTFHRKGWKKMHNDEFDELAVKMDTECVTMPSLGKDVVVEKKYLRWKDCPNRFEDAELSKQISACLAWVSPDLDSSTTKGDRKKGWLNSDARVCHTDGTAADKCGTMSNMLMKQMLTVVSKGGDEAVERTTAFCKLVDEAMCDLPDGLDEATTMCAGEVMSVSRAVLEVAKAEGSEGTMADVERLCTAKSNKLAGAVKVQLSKSPVWNDLIAHYMKYAVVNETYKGDLASAAGSIPVTDFNKAATLTALVAAHKALHGLSEKMDPDKVKPYTQQVRARVDVCFNMHLELFGKREI